MFKPKAILEMNYNFGCHKCRPVGIIKGSVEFGTLLHRKFISEQYVYERHLMYESRLSDLNKQYGWGVHYQNTTQDKINDQFAELRKTAKLVE